MGWTAWTLPVVWAQAAGSGAGSSAATTPNALAPLALRRWCGGQTLCSPESVPSLFGVWVWLAGLGALLLLVMAFQGPGGALRQLFDLPGHARLTAAAVRRCRRAGRMAAVVIGATVLSWTGSQSLSFQRPEGRDDMLLLTRTRGPGELAVEQGAFAALTPLRDVASLGGNLPLVVAATLVLFRTSADTWGGPPVPGKRRPRPSAWAPVCWCCGGLLVLYRLVSVGSGSADLPLGGCLMVEAVVVPAVMAICDGILLAWVLVEVRDAGSDHPDGAAFDPHAAVALMPGTVVACLLALPARYLATAVLLASYYLPSSAGSSPVGTFLRWQLGRGLADVQGVALLAAGLAGAAAWGGGGVGGAVRGYLRMLATQGGRVVAVLGLAGLAAGAASAAAYLIVLALPAATWVLNAADAYAHFATLPVGLGALAALVELGERSLPEATLMPVAAAAEAAYAPPAA